MKRQFTSLATALTGLLIATGVPTAQAATYSVTSLADSGANSLRSAIQQVNASPVPAGKYHTIKLDVRGTIQLQTALPDIKHGVAIVGPGRDTLVIDASTAREGAGSNRCYTPVLKFAVSANLSLIHI